MALMCSQITQTRSADGRIIDEILPGSRNVLKTTLPQDLDQSSVSYESKKHEKDNRVKDLLDSTRRRTDGESSTPTLTPTVLVPPESASPTHAPNWNMPTPQPQHSFGTLRPTAVTFNPSVQPTMDSDESSDKQSSKSSEENYNIIIAVAVVGGVIVIACVAILIYWHVYTRVAAPHFSNISGDQGGISLPNFFK